MRLLVCSAAAAAAPHAHTRPHPAAPGPQYAVEYVRGCQEGEDPTRRLMNAGLKHYTAYSLETNRFASKANISLFDLWDTYLPQFEAGFTRGRAAGAMCSYVSIALNGSAVAVPSCASAYLLDTIVRGYWGRPDAVHTSDCGAVSSMATANHYSANLTHAAADALRGGLDLNSERTLPANLGLALEVSGSEEGGRER